MWMAIPRMSPVLRGLLPLPLPRSNFCFLSSSTAWYLRSALFPLSPPLLCPHQFIEHVPQWTLSPQLSEHFLSYKPLLFISWSQKSPQRRPQDPQRNSQKLRTGSSLKRWWIGFHPLDQGPILSTSLCPDLPRQQEEQTSSVGAEVRTWLPESSPAASSSSSGLEYHLPGLPMGVSCCSGPSPSPCLGLPHSTVPTLRQSRNTVSLALYLQGLEQRLAHSQCRENYLLNEWVNPP